MGFIRYAILIILGIAMLLGLSSATFIVSVWSGLVAYGLIKRNKILLRVLGGSEFDNPQPGEYKAFLVISVGLLITGFAQLLRIL